MPAGMPTPLTPMFTRGLPSAADVMPKAPRVPTPIKIYYDSVIKGETSPITNKDFTPEELAAVQQLVTASRVEEPSKIHNRQKLLLGRSAQPLPLFETPGAVTYATYQKPSADVPEQMWSRNLPAGMGRGMPNNVGARIGPMGLLDPQGRVANTLGQFNYTHDAEGGTTVTDKYNFNNHGYLGDWEQASLLEKAALAVASLGYMPARVYGEKILPNSTGRNVKLTLPPVNPHR